MKELIGGMKRMVIGKEKGEEIKGEMELGLMFGEDVEEEEVEERGGGGS